MRTSVSHVLNLGRGGPDRAESAEDARLANEARSICLPDGYHFSSKLPGAFAFLMVIDALLRFKGLLGNAGVGKKPLSSPFL